jgi:hypothetical protein
MLSGVAGAQTSTIGLTERRRMGRSELFGQAGVALVP